MKKIFIERLIVNIIIAIILFVLVINLIDEKIAFIICLFVLLFHLFMTTKSTYKKKKIINKLDVKNKLKIEQELENSIFDCIDYTLTDDFIFNKNSLDIIYYEDIYLIKNDITVSIGPKSRVYPCTYIVSKNKNFCLVNYSMNFVDGSTKILDLYDFIIYKNKNVLINDTKENKNILKKKYNINLKSNLKIKSIRNLKIIKLYY